jgi:biopolymer transport protein ExbB
MDGLKQFVEWGVIGLLLGLSVWAVAVAIERFGYYRRLRVADFATRVELESALTRRLVVIGTVAANAPYIGLLGTVMGIMLTFQSMGATGAVDVKSIMTGLSLALKATAMGLLVAIPCVALNNALRRRVKERLAEYEAAAEKQARGY